MKKNVGISYKAFAVILAVVLILGGTIGGTMAWLIDKDDVTNTFTESDISIELTESEDLDLKMIPGHTITKDPKVTVEKGSEDCYLFVKIDKSENYGTYLEDCAVVDGWTALDKNANPGVYYREVSSNSTEDQTFSVLKGDTVTVRDTVTKEQMNDIEEGKNPTLTFTAYAVQLYKTNEQKFDIAEAWVKADTLGNQTTNPEA